MVDKPVECFSVGFEVVLVSAKVVTMGRGEEVSKLVVCPIDLVGFVIASVAQVVGLGDRVVGIRVVCLKNLVGFELVTAPVVTMGGDVVVGKIVVCLTSVTASVVTLGGYVVVGVVVVASPVVTIGGGVVVSKLVVCFTGSVGFEVVTFLRRRTLIGTMRIKMA